ncbi:GNAT family N-acetyltransferase [Jiulongibacter sp. NS-SX5]|uniref:GNAT family N-acetyltransferase n=1 Tax=Jiulongibacter sp. NS-SX5 TaxID=3463854 RepID=UPI0040582619
MKTTPSILIRQAFPSDRDLLARIGKQSFIESHGSSAASSDIEEYASLNFTSDNFLEELIDDKNVYYLIYFDDKPAGYSKIVFNEGHENIAEQNVAKLERIYILEDFYRKQLGSKLFKLNLELSKEKNQSGMWLYVWEGNQRAVSFYQKMGFEIIGSHDFKISDNHSNPNHRMYLKF